MRLKKGDKVEVRNKNDAPISWRGAKILSINAHTYRVQYDSYHGMAKEQMVEMVSKKFVRPCPPLVRGAENCIAGDIVEVFYEFNWKMAAILSLVGKKGSKSKKEIFLRYLVRILGCSEEIIVDYSNIRMRQIWHDDKWILIGKSCEDVIASKPSTSNYYQKLNSRIPQINRRSGKRPRNDYMNGQDETAILEYDIMYSRSLKRMTPYGSSIVEAHNGHAEKLRAIGKNGRKQRVAAARVIEKGHSWRHASFASKAYR